MSQVSSVSASDGEVVAVRIGPAARVSGYGRLKKIAAAIEQSASRAAHAAGAPVSMAPGDERWAVLLDPPALAIAWALERGVAIGVKAAIAQWLEFVQEAMHRWSTTPAQVILLDGSATDTAGLAEAVGSWSGHAIDLASIDGDDDNVDPVLHQLAQRACAATPQVAGMLWTLADAGLVFADTAPAVALASPGESFMRAPADGLGPAQDQSLSETRRLRQCLSDAQQELEAVYRKLSEASDEIKARSVTGWRPVRAGHIELAWVAQEQAAAPLQLRIRELQVAGRPLISRAHVELHLARGEPELRLHATGADPEILYSWLSDGSGEGGQFMRFRPADKEDRQRLQRLGEADWQTIVAVASLLQREADRLAGELPTAWRVAVARLRRQIAAIPARFRYDALQVTSAGPASDEFDLCFQGAAFGSLPLQQVRLRWSGTSLDWRLNEGATDLPLTLWPVDTAGVPAPSWSVPVGGNWAARRAHAQVWMAMGDEDRALVLAVLDALPASATVVSDDLARRRGGREAMAASAAALLRQVNGSLAAEQIKARLRRIRGLGWFLR